MIYFIQGETGGPIKIGSSWNPWQRAADLQTGNPAKLRVLAVIPGELAAEKAIHARFAALRHQGEWFTAAPELCAFIEGIMAAQVGKEPEPMSVQESVYGLSYDALQAIGQYVSASNDLRRAYDLITEAGGDELFSESDEYLVDHVDPDLAIRAADLRDVLYHREKQAERRANPFEEGVSAVGGGRIGFAVTAATLNGIVERARFLEAERRLHEDAVSCSPPCAFLGVNAGLDSPLDDAPLDSEAVH